MISSPSIIINHQSINYYFLQFQSFFLRPTSHFPISSQASSAHQSASETCTLMEVVVGVGEGLERWGMGKCFLTDFSMHSFIIRRSPFFLIVAGLVVVRCQSRCKHYRRRCLIRAPCCNEIFPCCHCHNETTVCSNFFPFLSLTVVHLLSMSYFS